MKPRSNSSPSTKPQNIPSQTAQPQQAVKGKASQEKPELIERRALKRDLLMKMSEDIKIIEEEPATVDDHNKSPPKKAESAKPQKKKKESEKKKPEAPITTNEIKTFQESAKKPKEE